MAVLRKHDARGPTVGAVNSSNRKRSHQRNESRVKSSTGSPSEVSGSPCISSSFSYTPENSFRCYFPHSDDVFDNMAQMTRHLREQNRGKKIHHYELIIAVYDSEEEEDGNQENDDCPPPVAEKKCRVETESHPAGPIETTESEETVPTVEEDTLPEIVFDSEDLPIDEMNVYLPTTDSAPAESHESTEQISKDERTCPECGKVFSRPSRLKYHMSTHSDERPYSCEICSTPFKTKDGLRKHNKRLHTGVANDASAAEAARSHGPSSAKEASSTSSTSSKRVEPRDKICLECNQTFSRPDVLRRHMALHSDAKPHSCGFCPTAFRRRDGLKAHLKSHHADCCVENTNESEHAPSDEEKEEEEEEVEDDGAPQDDSLANPYEIITEADVTCSKCSRVFDTPSEMRYHLIYHSDDTLRSCDICLTNFESKCELRAHQKQAHPETRDASSASDQMVDETPGQDTEFNEYVEQATYDLGCDLFVENGDEESSESEDSSSEEPGVVHLWLPQHCEIAPNVASYAKTCPVCGLGFNKASNYSQHLVTHSDERPFRCDLCGSKYKRRSHLTRHMKSKHTKN